MRKLRELLSSDHVSLDEEMGDAEEPSSSTSRDTRQESKRGKKLAIPSIWWKWLTRLKEANYNAEVWTSPSTRAGSQDVQDNVGARM